MFPSWYPRLGAISRSVRTPGRFVGFARSFASEARPQLQLSSSVVVTRPIANQRYSYEILFAQRSPSASFMPSFFVFPGGVVDPSDCDPRWADNAEDVVNTAAMTPMDSCEIPPFGMETHSCRVAALREMFEEVGILATEGVGLTRSLLCQAPHEDVPEWRERVNKNPSAFLDLVLEASTPLSVDALQPWLVFVTPRAQPRRFYTVFYLYDVAHDGAASLIAAQEPRLQAPEPTALDGVLAELTAAAESLVGELPAMHARPLDHMADLGWQQQQQHQQQRQRQQAEPACKEPGAVPPAFVGRDVAELLGKALVRDDPTTGASVDGEELTGMIWLTPDRALRLAALGALPMAPPQFYLLTQMARFRELDRLQAHLLKRLCGDASERRMEVLEPHLLPPGSDPAHCYPAATLPGDEAYPPELAEDGTVLPQALPGARNRVVGDLQRGGPFWLEARR